MPTLNLTPLLETFSIRSKDRGIIPFRPNWAQRQIISQVEFDYAEGKPSRIITLKSRQIGISTISEALLFAMAVTEPGTNAIVVAHDSSSSEVLFEMTKHFYETWPWRSMIPHRYATRRQLSLDGVDSNVWVMTAERAHAGRGRTIHALHASESAFWSRPVDTMVAFNQAMPHQPGTLQVIESTANGLGNWFEEQWTDATLGRNDYTPLFFPWFKHNDYLPCAGRCEDGTCEACQTEAERLGRLDSDEKDLLRLGATEAHLAWRRWAIPNLCYGSLDYFAQEYPACLTGETRVGTDLGLVPISEATEATWGTHGVIDATQQQQVGPVYKLRTKLGYEVRGTDDHPIFAESGLLIPLSATEGRRVRLDVPRFAEHQHTEEWFEAGILHSVTIDEDWGQFLGLFMGDGSYCHDTLSIVFDSRDQDLVEETRRLIKRLLGLDARSRQVGEKKGGTELRVSSQKLKETFDRLDLLRRGSNGVMRKVSVPECIWRSPKPVVRAFLQGLFEADGFNGYDHPRVVLFSRKLAFLKDLQLLLLGFGVTCRRHSRKARTGDYHYTAHEISLRARESQAFNERIGFLSERKRGVVQATSDARARPMEMADEVESVTADGHEPTYNLTIAGGERFDANGILTHNTDTEAFIVSGVNAFPEPQLKAVFEPLPAGVGRLIRDDRQVGKVKFVSDPTGPLRVYRMPSADTDWGQYFIGADPCYGVVKEGDFAAAQVINRQTKEQVAVWHGRINPFAFADELAKLGTFYNGAMIAPEVEGPGYGTAGRLIEIYPRIWQHRWPDKDPRYAISPTTLGWSTNWKRKQWAITKLAETIEGERITLHDKATYRELVGYVFYGQQGGPYGDVFGPAKGSQLHDDLVMALAICVVCEDTESDPIPYEARPPSHPDGVIMGEAVSGNEETW